MSARKCIVYFQSLLDEIDKQFDEEERELMQNLADVNGHEVVFRWIHTNRKQIQKYITLTPAGRKKLKLTWEAKTDRLFFFLGVVVYVRRAMAFAVCVDSFLPYVEHGADRLALSDAAEHMDTLYSAYMDLEPFDKMTPWR